MDVPRCVDDAFFGRTPASSTDRLLLAPPFIACDTTSGPRESEKPGGGWGKCDGIGMRWVGGETNPGLERAAVGLAGAG